MDAWNIKKPRTILKRRVRGFFGNGYTFKAYPLGVMRSMQPTGQASWHFPQPIHFSGSTLATKFSTLTAPYSHALTHFIQPMHAALQCFLATAPFSLLLQRTAACVTLSGNIFIRPLGQVLTHALQLWHAIVETLATPSQICIASYSQASTQSPRPKQP